MFELVKSIVRKFLTLTEFDGMPSPIDRILYTRTNGYAKRNKDHDERARILGWGPASSRQAELHARPLVDSQRAYKVVRLHLLGGILLLDVDERGDVRGGTTPLPGLSLDKLVDQPAEMPKGWSLLKHLDNGLDRKRA